jgi:hypothetical protein
MTICEDERNVYPIEAALDALEELHDFEADIRQGGSGLRVRECLCREAAAWRSARKITVAWRQELGLKVRLLDQV